MSVTPRVVGVLVVAAGVPLLACTSPGPAKPVREAARQAASSAPALTSHGWPVLDGLERLCGGRVYGTDQSEIAWDVFTSPDSPDQVLARYRSQLGEDGLERLGEEWTFRAETAGRISRTLSITAGAPPPTRSDCPPAPEGTRTFVMFSQMFSR